MYLPPQITSLNDDEFKEEEEDIPRRAYTFPTEDSWIEIDQQQNRVNPYLDFSTVTQVKSSVKKPRKKSTLSTGSGDKTEQSLYFANEDQVVKNHLKLNGSIHIAQIVIILVAMLYFDWNHITVN